MRVMSDGGRLAALHAELMRSWSKMIFWDTDFTDNTDFYSFAFLLYLFDSLAAG